MKASKNWPPEASFLVDWLEKNNLIEEVEEIESLRINDAEDRTGIGPLFDFWDDTENPFYWVKKSVEYKRAYDSAKLSGGYKEFYKLRNKD